MDTQKLLLESVERIALVAPGQAGSDAATTSFTSFRKAVSHATNSRTDSAESLFGHLEPKGDVLSFLLAFYAARRIYRKQVVVVLDELLKVDSWLRVLKQDKALCDELPEDISKIISARRERRLSELQISQEAQTVLKESVVSKGTPWPDRVQVPTNTKAAEKVSADHASQQRKGIRRQRLSAACFLPMRVASGTALSGNVVLSKDELDAVYELLNRGRTEIERLGYSAVDSDPAISAFETFRRAVQQVMNTTSIRQDGNMLERLEPKGRILDFLVDVYERHQKYRSRVTSTLTRLLNLDSWDKAADSDEPPRGSPKPAAASPLPGSPLLRHAAPGGKWTPWGASPSSGTAASATLPRSRNPFASDVAAKDRGQAGYPGAFDLWKDPPTPLASSASQRRRPSLETGWPTGDAMPKAHTASALSTVFAGSSSWGGSPRPPKPTNPFGASFTPDVKRPVASPKSAATNPFKKDVRSPAPGPAPFSGAPTAAASKNPFLQAHRSDIQVSGSVPKAPW